MKNFTEEEIIETINNILLSYGINNSIEEKTIEIDLETYLKKVIGSVFREGIIARSE